MLISRKTDYALRCLVYLAQQPAGARVSTAEVSRRLRISRAFLAKIVQRLVGEKIVKTAKGKGGGLWLVDKGVDLAAIIALFEPDSCLNKCLSPKFNCFLAKECPIHRFLAKTQGELLAKFAKVTVGKLAQKGR
ncbi:MAG: Rrf2 family transcriptional regulator [Candidatus Margulisiibacteriota bacterium]